MTESKPAHDVDGSLNTGSEVTFDIVCFTCNSEDKIQEAEGYCLDCCEYMCTSCLRDHRRFSATKHHKIVEKENMPAKQRVSSVCDICTERCQAHKDDIIKYFCPAHKVLGCSVCVTLKHKLCDDVAFIPDAAADLSGSQEFKDFQNKLENLIKKSEYITKTAQSNIMLSADYREKAVQEIETYRQELNVTLDKLKEDIEHQTDEMQVKDTEKMDMMTNISNQVLAELQRMSSDIKLLLDKKQHCKLFIEMKRTKDKLSVIKDRLPNEEDLLVTAVRFQPNLELQKEISRKDAFGKLLVKNPSEINATFLTDINVKTLRNTAITCNVTSAVLLSENKLVITDWDNKSVKVIDTAHTQVISEYKTWTGPCDVIAVDKTQVAVTLPDVKTIQFLESEDELRLGELITFDNQCCYVACVDDKLIVSFSEPCEVRILNMAGEVLQTFATSSQGDRLFSSAPYLSVSSFNQAIYAADDERNRVTMLDMDGDVGAVYEDADLKLADHMTVDDNGIVYISDYSSNSIHLLTPDCRKVKILLSECDGIWRPRGICYCKVTRRLYVTMVLDDEIKVFQLS